METKQGETKMSCAGFFETLQRQTEEESFKKQILPEIQRLKDKLARKLVSLRVKGDFRNDKQAIREVKAELEWLEKTEKSIKKLVET